MNARARDHSIGMPARPVGEIVIALVGNPNVGKSTLFNALTGLGVSTAHYPGTTRQVQTGVADVGERQVGVIDLPGTYALTGTAEADVVARRAIRDLDPDVVVVIVDPATLARSLVPALEALDAGLRVVLAVNLADEARRAGLSVDVGALAKELGVQAISTTATQGLGVREVVEAAFASSVGPVPSRVGYSPDFEALLEPLVKACCVSAGPESACQEMAFGLIEEHGDVSESASPAVRRAADRVRTAMRSHFGEEPAVHLSRERHGAAGLIAESVTSRVSRARRLVSPDFWALTTRPLTGVPLVLLATAAVFAFLFFAGEALSSGFSRLWEAFAAPPITVAITAIAGHGLVSRVLLWGFDAGIEASLAIGIPYILTFYFLLGLLEDTGYLNSLAFLSDRVMHRLGMHGRAIVPLVAAAGCNVPALIAAGQLGTERERRIASTLVLFVPCSARTAVILGAVGHYIGWRPALMVFGIVLVLWLAMALLLDRMLPGESRGLVMEMFGFRRPSVKRVAAKAWHQFREFLFIATPIVIVGSLVLGGLYESGWLLYLSRPLAPVVQVWLGLPAVAGVTLIVGMLRKELSLQLLVALAVSVGGVAGGLAGIMTPTNLVVYALVNAIALPCISSVSVFWRRRGTLETIGVVTASVVVALAAGGVVARVLPLLGFGV